jgi:hypothetical protein
VLLQISGVMADSPAEKAGAMVGHLIVGINGCSAVGKPIGDVMKMLAAAPIAIDLDLADVTTATLALAPETVALNIAVRVLPVSRTTAEQPLGCKACTINGASSVQLLNIVPGSPLDRAGAREFDAVVEIGGVFVFGAGHEAVLSRLAAATGSFALVVAAGADAGLTSSFVGIEGAMADAGVEAIPSADSGVDRDALVAMSGSLPGTYGWMSTMYVGNSHRVAVVDHPFEV